MHIAWAAQCQNSTPPTELSITTASLSCFFLLVTIPTNLLVCLAILLDPNKELRTQFNCFTFNLALSDLLVGSVTELLYMYFHIQESMNDEFGHKDDRAMIFSIHIPFFASAVASTLSIAALAVERYLAITSPFRYRQYFSIKLSVILSIVIWVVALSFGSIRVFTDYVVQSFIFVTSALSFTVIVVCVSSFRIRSTLRKASQNWAEIGMDSTREDDVVFQKMLTKTFEIIMVALIFCYLPVCVMVYYMMFCKTCDCRAIMWFRDAVVWMVLLNSAINPFIYAFRSKSFRSAIWIIIHCKRSETRLTLQRQFLASYAREKITNKRSKSSGIVVYGSISTSDEDNLCSSYHKATITT